MNDSKSYHSRLFCEQCGIDVIPDRTVTYGWNEMTFCSESCKDGWLSENHHYFE